MKFENSFDKYVCYGDSISTEIDGFFVKAQIHYDEHSNIDDDDSHNPDQSVTGCGDEQQEKLLAARKAWFDDEWWYGGVVVTFHKAGIKIHEISLWGIEVNYPDSDNSYLTEVANELLKEGLEPAKKAVWDTIIKLGGLVQ